MWLKEYLPTQVPSRARSDPTYHTPAEGHIVLIVDTSSPRYSYPRGKIKKTYPDPDNQVHVVDVETTGGIFRRPTSKIVVLVSSEAAAAPCPEVWCYAPKGRMLRTAALLTKNALATLALMFCSCCRFCVFNNRCSHIINCNGDFGYRRVSPHFLLFFIDFEERISCGVVGK
ncbi:hypothetical protein EVAR_309_1 [Eumeta japonica]|uniref:DUF5641 domain-containing protein n=1 Tax=Eumeta variegata TaxID=151549 RepID=A0A4C1S9R9_EUMVA|nr:hypothetical protein EVAR_309_1 [Eumeta japonica]